MISKELQNTIAQAVLASGIGVQPYVVMAIAEKESNGVMLWNVKTASGGNKDIPIFRPEAHKFYAYLSGTQRDLAVKQRLASSKRGAVGVPAKSQARYIMLQRMLDINTEAALMSCSMGFGQVMGFHYKKLGYSTARAMWEHAHTVEGQVEQVLKFFKLTPALLKAAEKEDVDKIGYYYNGPKYKENRYAEDIQRYIVRYKTASTGVPIVMSPSSPDWSRRIAALGFDTTKQFQTQYNLEPDGVIGKLTKETVESAEDKAKHEATRPERQTVKLGGAGLAVTGIAAIGNNADTAMATIRPILAATTELRSYGTDILLFGGAGIALAAVAALLYQKFMKA